MTRAEEFRAEQQRRGPRNGRNRKRSKPGSPLDERSRSAKHAGRKATRALEGGTRVSRKSTRKSANRAKPDTNFNLRESLQKGSPSARARKARARTVHVRGR